MIDLGVKYLGLDLKSPIIVGSNGLSNSIENIKKIEQYGAGAVVLKSLFEEQIRNEIDSMSISTSDGYYGEGLEYLDYYTKKNSLDKYLDLISEAKKEATIPIIASINCQSAKEWTSFATDIEKAGADALELNMFVLPNDFGKDGSSYEKLYFDILKKVKKKISIPVALKIGSFFSNPLNMGTKLAQKKADGLVLFNRFYQPDIDIENLKLKSGSVFTTSEDIFTPLRWIAMISEQIRCDISATTGVHDYQGVVKYLLAGADTVQLTSILYRKGLQEIEKITADLIAWAERKEFKSVLDFKGKLCQKKLNNSNNFERVQFMKYYSDRK